MNEAGQRIALPMIHPRSGLATPGLPPRRSGAPTNFECEGSCHFDLRLPLGYGRQFRCADRIAQTIYFGGKL